MSFSDNKITAEMLNGKGVVGMPNTPDLPASEMQRKFDELALEVIVPAYNELCDALEEGSAEQGETISGISEKVNENTDNIAKLETAKQDKLTAIEPLSIEETEEGTTELKVDLSEYAKTEDIPTKTSDLNNDSGFLTEHQDISGKQDKLIAGNNITIKGNVISATGGGGGGTNVSVEPIVTIGTHIADITVDGEKIELYAPTGGGDIKDELWKRDRPYFVFIDDDGREEFKNIYTNILEPRNIKAGLSICFSDYLLGSTGYLSVAELKEYEAQGNDILCHSTSIDTLVPSTADAVLRYCISQLKKYGFTNNGVFVYPNGNTGEDRIAIESITSNYFNYGINVNYDHNCPVKIPIDNRLNIGRIFINSANLNTDAVKQYISEIINDTFENNKLLIISTHSNKCDTEYLSEVLDTIINRGGIFESPVTVFKDLERTYVEAQLDTKADVSALDTKADVSALDTKANKTENADWLKSKNLCPNNFVNGFYSGGDGSFAYLPNWVCSKEKFKVEPNKTYTVSFNLTDCTYMGCAMYSESGIFIGFSPSRTFRTLGNVKYIALNFKNDSATSLSVDNVKNVQVEEGTVATPYQPYSMSNVALTPYAQTQSNRSLLDNPWFTVNQRNVTSVNTDGDYIADRWLVESAKGTMPSDCHVTLSNGIIELKSTTDCYVGIEQKIESGLISDNEICTISIMLEDNSIISSPFAFKNATVDLNSNIRLYSIASRPIIIRSRGNATTRIKAIKLEKGSISTLANDVAPNYTEELMKCQGSTADSSDTYANDGVLKNNGQFYYIRRNGNVTLNLQGSMTFASDGMTLANLIPEGYRPKTTTIALMQVFNGSSYVIAKLIANTTGALQIVSQYGTVISGAQLSYSYGFSISYTI